MNAHQRRHFTLRWSRAGGWFRLFGYGLGLIDHRQSPPLFSERNTGRTIGEGENAMRVPRRTYLHIGPYCLRWVGTWPRRNRG